MSHICASDITHNRFLGLQIFADLHARLFDGAVGSMPKSLRDYAFSEGCYCLDAPDEFPAGGCRWYQIDSEDGIPEQIIAYREWGGEND